MSLMLKGCWTGEKGGAQGETPIVTHQPSNREQRSRKYSGNERHECKCATLHSMAAIRHGGQLHLIQIKNSIPQLH